jgi:endonuclease/exonuclease/phosphatase (EEP) superfamily protein YafD
MHVAQITAGLLLVLLGFLAFGSLLNLSNHPHWFIRAWDFPRVQIIVVGWLLGSGFLLLRYAAGSQQLPAMWPFLAIAVFLTAWHGFRIVPYTRLLPKQSSDTPVELRADHRKDASTVRMVMTNVEMENDRYEEWMNVVGAVDPDILLVAEIDDAWVNATKEFASRYPYQVIHPQDNWYGMMLLSRLPISDHKVRHLIQKDVPSIDAKLVMDDGTTIRFVGVHPRPPEPIRDNDATARDAELTLWGAELADETGPVIIGGDLNDVAWSQTTRLFLRTSELLDPRRGRGFYNSFHAKRWYMRFPLDHVFHSPHFTVSRIERLGFVGSDHFPILIDLRHTPAKFDDHDVLTNKESDADEINTRLERAVEAKDLDGEAVDESRQGRKPSVD